MDPLGEGEEKGLGIGREGKGVSKGSRERWEGEEKDGKGGEKGTCPHS